MAVTPVSSANAAPFQPPADSESAYLNYDAFLRLLVAQLQNQDPTEPMDSAQYLGQLASFSSVEQGIKTNSKLDSLMTSLALSQADGLIGRTATSADGLKSGIIKSIEIGSGFSLAVLDNGQRVALGPGVTIS
jgi:flagellar basal-body rod modification protein FlgD